MLLTTTIIGVRVGGMNEANTAQQHNTLGTVEISPGMFMVEHPDTHELLKLKVDLRLLLDKWRTMGGDENDSTGYAPAFRHCAKELEEALK